MPARIQVWSFNGATFWLWPFPKLMTLLFPLLFQIRSLPCLAANPLEEALQTLVLWQRCLSAEWRSTFFTHTLVFNETDAIKISRPNYFLSLRSGGEIVLLVPPVLNKGISAVFSISCVKVGVNRPAASVLGLSSMFVVLVYLCHIAHHFWLFCALVQWELGRNSESNFVFQSNGADQFGIDNRNLFQEENPAAGSDVPPALPPKTGTPTRPPPPPPGQWSSARVRVSCVIPACRWCKSDLPLFVYSGKRSSLSRTESNEAFQRRGHFHTQPLGDFSSSSSSLPAKDPVADPFAPSSPPRHSVRDADRFASFDKVSSSLSSSPSPSLDSE